MGREHGYYARTDLPYEGRLALMVAFHSQSLWPTPHLNGGVHSQVHVIRERRHVLAGPADTLDRLALGFACFCLLWRWLEFLLLLLQRCLNTLLAVVATRGRFCAPGQSSSLRIARLSRTRSCAAGSPSRSASADNTPSAWKGVRSCARSASRKQSRESAVSLGGGRARAIYR
jgi:hypothetical protein